MLLVSTALHAPFVALVGSLVAQTRFGAWAVPLAVAALIVVHLPLAQRLLDWSDESRSSALRIWAVDSPYFVHFVAMMLFGPTGLLALIALLVAGAVVGHRPPLADVLGPMYLAAAALGAYGTFIGRFWTPVRTVRVPVRNLPAELDGFCIVQLSDVHCGPYLPRVFYRRLARRASGAGADVIVLTGDMITSGPGYVDDVRDLVSNLRAPSGVFASLGNHDYFGVEREVADAMEAGGATVLRNAGASVAEDRGGGIYLGAIDDVWTSRHDLSRALLGKRPDVPCVLLAHDPDVFDAIAETNEVDLVLAGHTHGGQFGVPFFTRTLNLARLRFRYALGLYRRGRAALYVHPGNGTTGPPARIGVTPEIARLVLVRADDASALAAEREHAVRSRLPSEQPS